MGLISPERNMAIEYSCSTIKAFTTYVHTKKAASSPEKTIVKGGLPVIYVGFVVLDRCSEFFSPSCNGWFCHHLLVKKKKKSEKKKRKKMVMLRRRARVIFFCEDGDAENLLGLAPMSPRGQDR